MSTKKFSLKYALGEILIITTGVLIAFVINSWSASRKERQTEIKTLIEIAQGVRTDLEDMKINATGHKGRVEAYKFILDFIKNNEKFDDTLAFYLGYSRGFTYFISNPGPYETLKSRGIDIVTNDSLRLAISDYYEIAYDQIFANEQEHMDHIKDFIKPIFIKNFILNTNTGRAIPVDYAALRQNQEVVETFTWAYAVDFFTMKAYEDAIIKGEKLISMIESEVETELSD